MTGLQRVPGQDMMWLRNEIGSKVFRLPTRETQLVVIQGRRGEHVPVHGYTHGAVLYVASGRIRFDGEEYAAGDGAVFAPGHDHYFTGVFLEDSVYLVARTAEDEVTLPDLGETAAAFPDA